MWLDLVILLIEGRVVNLLKPFWSAMIYDNLRVQLVEPVV
jgi:hypothetical protein